MNGTGGAPHRDARIRAANSRHAEAVIDELARCGVRHVIVAPGSRSTPLVLAAARHPGLETLVQIDERSAGFLALGAGKGEGRPAAVITTSGTAVANLLPAVVEAAQAEVPLLLLTADRPVRLRGTDANQAIVQPGIFGPYVRHEQELAPSLDADPQAARHLRSSVARAVAAATGDPAGPVHLNLPFDKPLEPAEPVSHTRDDPVQTEAGAPGEPMDGRPGGASWTRVAPRRIRADAAEVDRLADELGAARRPLLIGGRLPHPAESGPALAALAERLGAPLLADPLSGARFAGGTAVIGAYDLILGSQRCSAALRPDRIVRFGASPTSAALLAWLEGLEGVPLTVVDGGAGWKDHQGLADRMVHADPALLARELSRSARNGGTGAPDARSEVAAERARWIERWQILERTASDAAAGALDDEPCEGSVLHSVVKTLPDDELLWVSSSMPIRDLDAFGLPALRREGKRGEESGEGVGLVVHANRGASGIDGVVSSAIGAGVGAGRHVTSVIGDLALLHDANGLLALRDARAGDEPLRLTLVVINNDGGGIFHMLPVRSHEPEFTRFFATPHGLDPARIAALHGLGHRRIDLRDLAASRPAPELRELRTVLSEVRRETSTMVEVRTDRDENRTRRALVRAVVHRALEGTLDGA